MGVTERTFGWLALAALIVITGAALIVIFTAGVSACGK